MGAQHDWGTALRRRGVGVWLLLAAAVLSGCGQAAAGPTGAGVPTGATASAQPIGSPIAGGAITCSSPGSSPDPHVSVPSAPHGLFVLAPGPTSPLAGPVSHYPIGNPAIRGAPVAAHG